MGVRTRREPRRNANKTRARTASVSTFVSGVADEQQREDLATVLAIMEKVTGEPPTMWGSSIVGFGRYHYKYASGREGDFFLTGASPRKGNLTLYIMPGFTNYSDLLDKLGKHKTAKSCLYIKRLDDVDTKVLEKLIARSIAEMRRLYPA